MGAPIRTADLLAGNIQEAAGDLDDLIEGLEELLDAVGDYDTAEEYYDGTRQEFFASDKFRQKLEQTGTTFRLNYAKTPVDSMVERLEINDIVGGDDTTRKVLQAIWEINQMDIEAADIMLRTCEFGDAYALVWPAEGADIDEDSDSEAENVGIDIFYNDPRTMRAIYDPENPRRMRYVIKFWQSKRIKGREQFRANLYYKDRIEKFVTKPGVNTRNNFEAGDWIRYIDSEDGTWPVKNPFDHIPVFHFRTARPYGVPEHKEAYGPQDAITKIVVTHMNTMDYHSFPQRYALSGEDLDDDDQDGEDFEITDDDDDSGLIGTSESRSQMRAEPGHMWFLRNVKGVGQFEAAGADVFMNPLPIYVRAAAQTSRTPVYRFDSTGNPPSGQSLKVAEQPFIKKVQNRQKSLGATWDDLLGFIVKIVKQLAPESLTSSEAETESIDEPLELELDDALPESDEDSEFNGDEFEDNEGVPGRCTVSWANPSAQDDQLTWDVALLKRNAGIPIRQVLLDAGYSKKQLDAWGVPASKWDNTAPSQLNLPVNEPTNLPGIRPNPNATTGELE